MAEIVKITHLEDTNSNVIAGKRAGLIALATDVGASGEVSMYDSSLNRHRLVTLDDSGDCSSDIASASIDTLTTETTTATESVTTPIIKPAADSTTAVQVTKADGSTVVMNVDTTNSIVSTKSGANSRSAITVVRSGGSQEIVRLFEDASGNGVLRALDTSAADKVYLSASGDSYLTGGNVGVGVTAPTEKLDIAGNIRVGVKTVATDKSIKLIAEQYDSAIETEGALPLFAYNDATGNTVNIGGGSSAQNSATLVKLYAAANATTRTGTEILRAAINGVGIGAVSPTAKLDVLSAENSEPVMRIKGTGTADLLNVMDNTTEVFTILDGGNVGVGVTAPTEKIESSANVKATEISMMKSQEFYAHEVGGVLSNGQTIDIPIAGNGGLILVRAEMVQAAIRRSITYLFVTTKTGNNSTCAYTAIGNALADSGAGLDPVSLGHALNGTNIRFTFGNVSGNVLCTVRSNRISQMFTAA